MNLGFIAAEGSASQGLNTQELGRASIVTWKALLASQFLHRKLSDLGAVRRDHYLRTLSHGRLGGLASMSWD